MSCTKRKCLLILGFREIWKLMQGTTVLCNVVLNFMDNLWSEKKGKQWAQSVEDYFKKVRFLCSIAANWPCITETTSCLYTFNLHNSDFKLCFIDISILWFVSVLSFIMGPGDFQTWLITKIILNVYYYFYCCCCYFHHYHQLVIISGYYESVNLGCVYGICVAITSQIILINLIGKQFRYFICTHIML